MPDDADSVQALDVDRREEEWLRLVRLRSKSQKNGGPRDRDIGLVHSHQ
jgi:hypothetical protein